uniref:Uncharacterized protein n=1 Tax=Amphimedon queenslandica TaxID=400682 RepID=A0A1X7V118_AMPQE
PKKNWLSCIWQHPKDCCITGRKSDGASGHHVEHTLLSEQ